MMTDSVLPQILRILSLLLLLVYPAVLIANAMQAAALLESRKRGGVAVPRRALMSLFVIGTTAYPLVVLGCRMMSARASDPAGDLAWSAAPLAFVGVLAALLALLNKSEMND